MERKPCMTKKTIQNIRLIFSIVLSLMLIATGILLMISCVGIYKIGNRPFTTENISAAFAKIAIPVWITVALTIVGIIATLFFPNEKKRVKAIKEKKSTLALLQKKLNMDACDQNTLTLIKKEQKTHTVLQIGAIAIVCAAAVPAVIYAFDFNNYSADYNASVIAACLWILPCTLVAMGVSVAFVYLENASVERQIGYIKSAIAQSKSVVSAPVAPKNCDRKKLVMGIRIALLVAAIALIIAGILNGGMADVLAKAVNICTECIGLG